MRVSKSEHFVWTLFAIGRGGHNLFCLKTIQLDLHHLALGSKGMMHLVKLQNFQLLTQPVVCDNRWCLHTSCVCMCTRTGVSGCVWQRLTLPAQDWLWLFLWLCESDCRWFSRLISSGCMAECSRFFAAGRQTDWWSDGQTDRQAHGKCLILFPHQRNGDHVSTSVSINVGLQQWEKSDYTDGQSKCLSCKSLAVMKGMRSYQLWTEKPQEVHNRETYVKQYFSHAGCYAAHYNRQIAWT